MSPKTVVKMTDSTVKFPYLQREKIATTRLFLLPYGFLDIVLGQKRKTENIKLGCFTFQCNKLLARLHIPGTTH